MNLQQQPPMRVPHPIPYQGSKRRLAPAIVAYVPHATARLIEPFAGSAAVSLMAALHGKAAAFILNDANAPLMQLWSAIVHAPHALADAYAELWHAQAGRERVFYDEIRAAFNRSQEPHYLLFLLARCVKAAVRYNRAGAFNQSADHRRRGAHPATMRRHLGGAAALLRDRATLMAGDFRAALDQATPDDVVYLDPPYQGVSGGRDQRYINGLTLQALIEALHDLHARGIAYMFSYDGRTGSKRFGAQLPAALELHHLQLYAGRSTQATLLGRAAHTFESFYLSPALVARLDCARVPGYMIAQKERAQWHGELPLSFVT